MNLPTSVFLSRVDWKTKPHACGAAAFVNAGRIDMDLISDTFGRDLLSFYIEYKTRRNISLVHYHLRQCNIVLLCHNWLVDI